MVAVGGLPLSAQSLTSGSKQHLEAATADRTAGTISALET